MTQATTETFDPTRPTLIVRYGSTAQRFRVLDGDVILLGRNRVCHLGLSGPDIADIHCIVSHGRTGWRVRDGGSRIGTRVNGQIIKDEALNNGDVIQIGSFLFEAHLPPEHGADAGSPEDQLHLRRSRRRLCRLALLYRRRFREERSRHKNNGHAPDPQLQRMGETYRERLRDLEQRTQQLARDEKELAAQREWLERQTESVAARAEEAQAALTQRLVEAAAEVRRLQDENEVLRQAAEQARSAPPLPVAIPASHADEARRLELRKQELDRFAAHLRRLHEELQQQAPGEPPVVAVPAASDADAEPLRLEMQHLHEQMAELRERIAAQDREIEERDFLIEELRQRSGCYPVGKVADIEACEAELIQLRRELEEERRLVQEERDQLQQRAEEMDEMVRQMELELSQERARWGRERAELDRLREEIRQERERAKRQAPAMERLAGLRGGLKNGH